MLPEAAAVREFLSRARRRAIAMRTIRFSAAGLAVAGAVAVVTPGSVSTLALAAAGALVLATAAATGRLWRAPGIVEVARDLERRTPASRNLLLTAAELAEAGALDGEAGPSDPATDALHSPITLRVFADARRVSDQVTLSRVLPAGSTIGVAAAAIVLAAGAVFVRQGTVNAETFLANPDTATLRGITVEVIPPAYSGRATVRLQDPQRIDALADSRIRVSATADAAGVTLDTVAGSIAMTAVSDVYSAEIVADADGFLALVPVSAAGGAGTRRLIGLSVTADGIPSVKISAPGRDMLVPDGRRTLAIALSAEDDLALKTLRLRYTRVSGSGENFSFAEGDVPVVVTQPSDRSWQAQAQWNLTPLALEPGDMVIYKGVATDRRPGAPAGESDTFILEIAAPGLSSADGFAIDDRENRYAISQQMVIVNTERLLARRKSMSTEDFQSAALDIAAEQRQVRAEFVFMMGGELADAGVDLNHLHEEAEAEAEDEIAAGRLANQGRLDILRAIRSMSRAAARLADHDATGALPIEKEALAFLQRAFSKSRYILRTLGSRERLDLSRRLTGVLAALGRNTRPAAEAPASPRADALRRVLSQVAGLQLDDAGAADQVTELAQRTLQVDAASAALRDASAKLTSLAVALGARASSVRLQRLRDEAATALGAIVRSELAAGATAPEPAGLAELAGALTDALRSGGTR